MNTTRLTMPANQIGQAKLRLFGVISGFFLLTAALLFGAPAHAQLKIDITGVGNNPIAFTAAPFQGNEGLPEDIKKIIEDDLVRSGYFRSINTTANIELNENTLIDPTAWKSIGVDALIVGSVKSCLTVAST